MVAFSGMINLPPPIGNNVIPLIESSSSFFSLLVKLKNTGGEFNHKSKVRGKVQGTRHKVQGTRYKQGSRYMVQARFKIQGTRKIQDTRHKEDSRYKVGRVY